MMGGMPDATMGGPASQPQKKTGAPEKRSVLPLTLRQVHAALAAPNSNSYTIDGAELATIKVVGQVVSVEEQSQNVRITIDDGTGMISTSKVKVGQSAEESGIPPMTAGQYVTVYGKLYVSGGIKSVNAFSYQLMSDMNELTYHIAEAMFVHRWNTQGPLKTPMPGLPSASATNLANGGGVGIGGGMAGMAGAGAGMAGMAGMAAMPATGLAGGAGAGGAGGPAADSALQTTVMNTVRTVNTETGAEIDWICTQVQPMGYSESQVREMVEYLTQEGHLYTTVDFNHVRSMED